MPLAFLFFLSLTFYALKVEATSFYVSSNNGNRNDANAGTDPNHPWASLSMVLDYGYNPGFRPGDTIYLDGTLSGSLFFDLSYSYGSGSQPLRITSLNPNSWSTIASNTDAITIYCANPPAGMNIVIDNLIIVGNSRYSGIVVTLWGSSNFNIYGLTVNNVDVSGFTRGGISSYRKPGCGFISNVVISNSAFHNNPGYSNTYAVQGSGIVMAGVQYCTVSNVKVYNNGGAVNTSPGPFGTWFFDADHVTVSDSSFYNNLSQGPDGGGLDFDCGTTNSVFQRVYTWNNWGTGFAINACSPGQGFNNDGSTANIVMQSSTSYGDSYHKKDCLLCVFAISNTVASNILYQDMTLTANGYGMIAVESSFSTWNYQYNTYQIVGLLTSGQVSQISAKNVQFHFDSTTFSANLFCNGLNPSCVSTALALPPTNYPSAAPVQAPSGGRSFYVSSIRSTASDSNEGTSASYPWRTLAKVVLNVVSLRRIAD